MSANTNELPAHVLLVPGIGNSGPDHWQTLWQAQLRSCSRVEQHDWDHPLCRDWLERLDEDIRVAGPRSLIVAHSLGCLLVVQWAARFCGNIMGALLVAVPDPYGPSFPPQALGFTPLPTDPLPFPSILVASADDPYADRKFAQARAASWGSQLIDVGAQGHINSASGLGDWPQGQALLRQLSGQRGSMPFVS